VANPQVVVDFVANTAGLSKGMKDAGGAAGGFGSKLKGLGKAAVVAGGAAGLGILAAATKIGVDEFVNATKVSAQTAAVLKSTGGAAGVTAGQVADLAGSLMRKSGVDDEAIQSGENLLLTFTKVQNKAGKGNDIFNQATKTMLDMSVALGQDTKSSAIQLGKALNDPIKGISALSKVGVSFTQAQKNQVKAMVQAGDTMGAQKLILKELNSEFGGSAEAAGKTLPGQINILKESFSNLAGSIVGMLAPAMKTVTDFFIQNPGLAKALVVGVIALSAAMVALNVVMAVSAAITAPYTLIILGIIAAIAAFIAIGVLLAKNWSTVTGILNAGFQAIKKAANDVFTWLNTTWSKLLAILTAPITAAVASITRSWATIKSTTTAVWNAIKTTINDVMGAIKTAVSTGVDAIKSAITGAWNAIRSTTTSVWNAVKNAVSGVVDEVKKLINGLATWISNTATGAVRTAVNKVKDTFHAVSDGAKAAYDGVKGAFNDMVHFIEGIVGSVGRAASSVANAIKKPINAVIGAWNSLGIPRVSIGIPSVKVLGKKIGGGNFGFGPIGFPDIPYLRSGAVVDTPTLAMVGEAGRELVTPERLLRQILAESRPSVRVFIGDTELRGLVRTEIVDSNTGIARTLLAGGAA
jgi:hypothetical protein